MAAVNAPRRPSYSLFPSTRPSMDGPLSYTDHAVATRTSEYSSRHSSPRTTGKELFAVEDPPIQNPAAVVPVRSKLESLYDLHSRSGLSQETAVEEREDVAATTNQVGDAAFTQQEHIIAPRDLWNVTAAEERESVVTAVGERESIPSVGERGDTTTFERQESIEPAPGRRKLPPASLPRVGTPQQMQSMFPTYDTDRALNEQFYLPSQMSPTYLPFDAVCKSPYSPDFVRPDDEPDNVGLIFKSVGKIDSDCTPEPEVAGLWHLAHRPRELGPAPSYRLRMYIRQPEQTRRSLIPRSRKKSNPEPLLTFGSSPDQPIISVSEECSPSSSRTGQQIWPKYCLRKHGASRFDALRHYPDGGDLLSEFKLKPTGATDDEWLFSNKHDSDDAIITSITPQAAVIKELLQGDGASVSSSTLSSSPSLPDFSDRAMNSSARHTCRLRFSTLPSLREQAYTLRHPALGMLRIKVTGDVRLPGAAPASKSQPSPPPPEARGSITLLAPVLENYPNPFDTPLSSPGYRIPEIVLASLDLSTSLLTLDGSALSDLVPQEPYIADHAVASIGAVLLAETKTPRLSQRGYFAPPPTHALVQKRARRMTMLGPRREKAVKVGKRDKAKDEVETAMATGFAALALVLGLAVEGLGKMVEKAGGSTKEDEGMMPLNG